MNAISYGKGIKNKWLRRLALVVSLLLILVFLVEGILLLGGKPIGNWVFRRLNDAQPGRAEMTGLRLSFLGGFPGFCLSLDRFRYYENKTEPAPLLAVERFSLRLNPWKLLRRNIDIQAVELDSGYLDLVVYPDSTLNLLRALGPLAEGSQTADTTATAASDLQIDVRQLRMQGIRIRYDDRPGERGGTLRVAALRHRFRYRSGLTRNRVELEAGVQRLWNAGDTLAVDLPLRLRTDLTTDLDSLRFDARLLEASLGTLTLAGEGYFHYSDGGAADLRFDAAFDNFDTRPLLFFDVLPATFFTERIDGRVQTSAIVRGRLLEETPFVDLTFQAEKVNFLNRKYLPLVVRLDAGGLFRTGEAERLRNARLRFDHFDLHTSDGYLRGQGQLTNFEQYQFDVELEADLGLQLVEEFYPLEAVEALRGRLHTDLYIYGAYDPASDYGLRLDGKGVLDVDSASLRLPGPDWTIHRFDLELEGRDSTLTARRLFLRVNDSDLALQGRLVNALEYYLGEAADLDGRLELRAQRLQLPDLLDSDPVGRLIDPELRNLTAALEFRGLAEGRIKGRLLPDGYLRINNLAFERSESPDLRRLSGSLTIKPDQIAMRNLKGALGQSDFYVAARLFHYIGLIERDTAQEFTLVYRLNSERMRANDFFYLNGEFQLPEQYRAEVLRDFNLNGNFQMNSRELYSDSRIPDYRLRIKQFDFELSLFPIAFRNLKINSYKENDRLVIEELSGNIGRSDLLLKGSLEERPGGSGVSKYLAELDLRSQYLDLDELLGMHLPGGEALVPRQSADTAALKEEIIDAKMEGYNPFANPFPNALLTGWIDSMRYFDRPMGHISARLQMQDDQTVILEELISDLGLGRATLLGMIDAADTSRVLLSLTGQLDEADLSQMDFPFNYGDANYLVNHNFSGFLEASIEAESRLLPDFSIDLGATNGTVDFSLRDGKINDFAPLLILADFLGEGRLDSVRVDDLQNSLILEDSSLIIPMMDINSSIGHMRLAGFQRMNGEMEYLFQLPLGLITSAAWTYLTGKESKEEAGEGEVQLGENTLIYVSVRLLGTTDEYEIKLGKGNSFRDLIREARQARREQRRQKKEE